MHGRFRILKDGFRPSEMIELKRKRKNFPGKSRIKTDLPGLSFFWDPKQEARRIFAAGQDPAGFFYTGIVINNDKH